MCENSHHNKIFVQVCYFGLCSLVKIIHQSHDVSKCEGTAYKKAPLKHSKHIFVILLKFILII